MHTSFDDQLSKFKGLLNVTTSRSIATLNTQSSSLKNRESHLVLTLDKEVQQFLSVDDSLSEVRHQANQSSVPLVDDLCEGSGARRHQNLTNSVVKPSHRLIINSKETLSSTLLRHLKGGAYHTVANNVKLHIFIPPLYTHVRGGGLTCTCMQCLHIRGGTRLFQF